MKDARPVMYLDVDDTLIDWSAGRARAGSGAREFLLEAVKHYEVRWLTFWCPEGVLNEQQVGHLANLFGVPQALVRSIRGLDWYRGGVGCDKVHGIAWDEHLDEYGRVKRPFIWVEDDGEVGAVLRARLKRLGLFHCYHPVNVSKDRDALLPLHRRLFGELSEGSETPSEDSAVPRILSEFGPAGTHL